MKNFLDFISNNLASFGLFLVSVITACSPIFVTLINNKHDTKNRKLEMYEKAKQDALKHFIDCCSKYFSVNSDEQLRIEVLSAMHTLLIYFDVDDVLQNNLLDAINNRKHKLLNSAVVSLSNQIKKL